MQIKGLLKYLFSSNRREISAWRKVLGFIPGNLQLYQLAATHRSANIKDSKGKALSNERLEYLGDAFIGAVIADILYRQFPDATEGMLTRTRSKIVCRNNLNDICHTIGLDKLIRISHGIKHNAHDIYGNAVEALVGAIYLDKGFETTERWVKEHIAQYSLHNSRNETEAAETDYKSKLFEWAQTKHKTIEFELANHNYRANLDQHTYTYQLYIDQQLAATGTGHNKRLAQQAAAEMAVKTYIKQQT